MKLEMFKEVFLSKECKDPIWDLKDEVKSEISNYIDTLLTKHNTKRYIFDIAINVLGVTTDSPKISVVCYASHGELGFVKCHEKDIRNEFRQKYPEIEINFR